MPRFRLGTGLRKRIREIRPRMLKKYRVFLNRRLELRGIRPDVRGIDETLDRLQRDLPSMSRYGDGELAIMMGESIRYQNFEPMLAVRLKEILRCSIDKHIACIPDVFGSNERMTPRARKWWKTELDDKRSIYLGSLDLRRTYYDAFVSRPFHDYGDQVTAQRHFDRWMQVWKGRKILFVEGSATRLGVGNNLFAGANSVRRLLAPAKHAFSVYDELLPAVVEELGNDRTTIVILALGPTATVLSYDLAKMGYTALDVGHLDIEYEWFLSGESGVSVPGKYVNESHGGQDVDDIVDDHYKHEIVARIGTRESE